MTEGDGEDQAARAFDDLRAEVSVLRRAFERLAAERAEQPEAVDYSETLGVIARDLSAIARRVDAMSHSPALALTPEEITRQIGAASSAARREDQRVLVATRQMLEEMVAKVGRQLHFHAEAHEQRRRVRRTGLACLMAGMAVWATLDGVVARAAPESWHWPERRAAWALDMPMRQAGLRLMATADPAAFRAIVAGDRIVTANRDAIEPCARIAGKAGHAVRCTIKIEAED